MKLNLVV